MTLAALVIGDPRWIVPAVGVAAVLALLLWHAYRRATTDAAVRTTCVLLKAFGLLIVVASLVNPLWSGVRARPGANLLALLVDDSASLTIRDADGDDSRGETLQAALGQDSGWQTRLAQDFDLRRYTFGSRLQNVDAFDDLQFAQQSTSLRSALESLGARYASRPAAGVLVFTDGIATDFGGDWSADDLPPVYPVVVGDDSGAKDVAIRTITVSTTSFEDAPVTVRAEVESTGCGGETLVAVLVDESGKAVATQRQAVAEEDAPLVFDFELRPRHRGVSFHRLTVRTAPEFDEADPLQKENTDEATLLNNTRLVRVERGASPRRILYVSGRPNWEFKFLNRALADDDQTELVGLIRIAKREAKFDFRGRAGESSNPLFRGFRKDADAQTEAYDEPVFVRVNVKDRQELRGGIPKTAEELFAYHAVVIDDLEAAQFTRDQLDLLEEFVSRRGGGLLMLGGAESFADGGYRHTPLEAMLPVFLDGRSVPAADEAEFTLNLTREGWLEPWVRLRNTEAQERTRLDEMAAFRIHNRVGRVKPGASVLATVSDGEGEVHPALAAQRFGRGRCAALTLGDVWRWHLKRAEPEDDDHHKAWRQTLRWLVADVPDRISIELDEAEGSRGAVHLRTRVRDVEFQPVDHADMTFTVHPPDGEAIEMRGQPSLEESGLFETVFVAKEAGGYRVEVSAGDEEGAEVETAVAGWVHEPASNEFRRVTPDREALQRLAESTGGRVLALDDLDAFAKSLRHEPVPVTETWTWPLWHQSWVFLLAVGCFAGEWGLRRWRGLP